MKKLVSILLTTVITLCSIGITVTASDTLLTEENFAGLSAGDINGQNGWTFVNSDTVGTVSATIENDDGNNVLNMSRTAVGSDNVDYDRYLKGAKSYAYKEINRNEMEYNVDYNIELKFKNNKGDSDNGSFHISFLIGDGSNSTVAEDAINIKVVPKYNRLQYFYVDGTTRKSGMYDRYTTNGEWTELKIVYHCKATTDGNYNSDSDYDIYVNDTLAASSIPAGKSYRGRARLTTGTIKTICFENPHDTVSEYLIDDIAIENSDIAAKFTLLENGNKIDSVNAISGDALQVELDVTNPLGVDMDITAIVAVYNNNRLYSVISENVSVSGAEKNKNVHLANELNVPKDKTRVLLKGMVWKADTMMPLIKPWEIKYIPFDNMTIACWGDSLTAGDGSSSSSLTAYPAILAKITGAEVYNLGVGGETATTIAARQGGLDIELHGGFTLGGEAGSTVNFDENTFLAENGITVIPRDTKKGCWNPCYINGIEGSLTATVDTSVVPRRLISATFTRKLNGETLVVDSNEIAHLVTAAKAKAEADYHIIFIGTNGGWGLDEYGNDLGKSGEAAYKALADMINRMISITRNPENYIVIGLTEKTSAFRQPLDEYMNNIFGSHYIAMGDYLSSEEAIKNAGLTVTEEDRNCIAKGTLPQSFCKSTTDNLHCNDYGYAQIAYKVKEKMCELFLENDDTTTLYSIGDSTMYNY